MKRRPYWLNCKAYDMVRKDYAERLLLQDKTRLFFVVACNVNTSHFHTGWYLAMNPTTVKELEAEDQTFKGYLEDFAYYNCQDAETGYYPVVYIERKGA